jgi:hypothetical protein
MLCLLNGSGLYGYVRHEERMKMFEADFQEFWSKYPRRVGKLAAKKEYDKVRRGGTSQDELMDGIEQYIRTKPTYADFCHPRTWLSQGRWMDEVKPAQTPFDRDEWMCEHTPHCLNRRSCGLLNAMKSRTA